MSLDVILIIVAVLIGGWQAVNAALAVIVLGTKQLIPADRGIAWYFILVSVSALVVIMALGFRIAEMNGYIGDKNAVAEEVRQADGN